MSARSDCQTSSAAGLEIWGGVECTINRVQDQWRDQLKLSGHEIRSDDLDRIASLGLKVVRYPVIWERTVQEVGAAEDWSWPDARLAGLKLRQLRPIVGLVHHGSGPLGVSLMEASFVSGLAAFAAKVAQRYPWVTDYTPVNEPLTTARFSGLYGYWYPHARTDDAFVRALINQCRGIALAMEAIRDVNSAARLIQTEDLAKIHSTQALAAQAEFENHRRWLSLDLLTGRVNRHHPLWNYLRESGATEPELDWFEQHPTSPAVLGFNYYLTSERFLDERLERYPPHTHGGNGRQQYADVEAVRVCDEGEIGLAKLLSEAWSRYRLPMAITEVHLGCHRESQLRWLLDIWNIVSRLQATGMDLRAITVWSLFGSFDWTNLCTRNGDHYESGVFDVRAGSPRPTILAKAVQRLSEGDTFDHPALPEKGWWQRKSRFIYQAPGPDRAVPCDSESSRHLRRPLVITGAAGILGRAFLDACRQRDLAILPLTRSQLDITHPSSIEQILQSHAPWAVINAAGFRSIDEAEADPANCRLANVVGPTCLAKACANRDISLLTFSSAFVFDGRQAWPYIETDSIAPLNVYGQSKAESERCVFDVLPRALIVRTSHLFSHDSPHDFLTRTLQQIVTGTPVLAPEDWIISPTYLPDLVHACLDLLIDGETGLWHLTNQGHASCADIARQAASQLCFDQQLIQGCPGGELKLNAFHPPFIALSSQRGLLLPSLTDSLGRYCDAIRATSLTSPVVCT